jgi:hypothetical protein
MIKIVYTQEAYNYGNVGKQAYDIETSINVIKDATIAEVVAAFIKILEIAEYPISQGAMERAIEEYFENN